jgi:hypothetical protein
MNTNPRRSATQARIERQSRTVSVKREAHKVLPNRMMCYLDSNTANIYTTTSNTTHPDPTLHVQTQAYTPIPKPNTQTKAKYPDQSQIPRPKPNTQTKAKYPDQSQTYGSKRNIQTKSKHDIPKPTAASKPVHLRPILLRLRPPRRRLIHELLQEQRQQTRQLFRLQRGGQDDQIEWSGVVFHVP